VISESSEFLDSPDKIIKMTADFDIINVRTEECKIDKSILVKDLSLYVKGPDEDEAFAKDPYLWTNFRRGNTILELYDPNDINKFISRTVGRKGHNKFFDL